MQNVITETFLVQSGKEIIGRFGIKEKRPKHLSTFRNQAHNVYYT